MALREWAHIRARCIPGHARASMYGKEWERCGGTEGITREEAAILIREWKADDASDYGRQVTDYEYITGRVGDPTPSQVHHEGVSIQSPYALWRVA